jgi:cytochrome c oxidase subunit II
MTSFSPPPERVWWREAIDRSELIWITVVVVWGIVLTLMMPLWHVYGNQNLSSEAYRTTPQTYLAKAQAVVDQYTVRTEGSRSTPVVRPPVGEDIYLVARLWDWWPIFELEAGQSYRLHVMSMDWQHGLSLQPANINVQVLPGYEMVMTVTPNRTGEHAIVCNEYCGILHHNMVGKLYVVDGEDRS